MEQGFERAVAAKTFAELEHILDIANFGQTKDGAFDKLVYHNCRNTRVPNL